VAPRKDSVRAGPIPDSYWVEPGKLLAGPHPGGTSAGETAGRVSSLLDAGVRCIVNLTEQGEEGPAQRYEEICRSLAAGRGLEVHCLRYSLWDGTSPSEAAVRELLDVVDACIERDRPVYIHCLVGLGRTGVMVGCWLVRHGIARPGGAIRHISRLRRHATTSRITSPATDEQIARVKGWKRGQ
jgi:hypothetical protein